MEHALPTAPWGEGWGLKHKLCQLVDSVPENLLIEQKILDLIPDT